ncbi:hypothetical protein PBI_SCTP2_129 [Salicola phage SCTP-2]|nr:hypothetical protein PBI_SCTP2_129 [Salicola phage SCTP-2]
MKKSNSLHIYVIHKRTASQKEKGKWDVYEEVYTRNSLKTNLLQTANVVLDCGNMEVRKDRGNTDYSFYEYLSYLAQHHNEPAKIKQYIDNIINNASNAEQQIEETKQHSDINNN